MTASRLGRIFGLTLCLWACAAHAARVVVLELAGDRGGRLRGQVEKALREAGNVELIPLNRYKAAAGRRGLNGARAMTGAAVAQFAPGLRLAVAVGGSVGAAFTVQILDREGQELWSRELPLVRGALSPENARKLAAAVGVAAHSGEREPATTPEPPAPEAAPEPATPDAASEPAAPEPRGPVTSPVSPPVPGDAARSPGANQGPPPGAGPGRTAALPVPAPPPPPARGAEQTPSGPRPSVLTLQLGGTTTWRTYCARPGVPRCAAYDQLAGQGTQPPGETVQFSTGVPYQGAGLEVDFFPLAGLEGAARGLGLSALYARAGSSSSITVSTPSTQTQPKLVRSVDQWLQALAVYRFFFAFGPRRLPGYVGARGGLAWRGFDVDPAAQVPLPGAQRLHGAVGLEASLPWIPLCRVEAAASWFPGAMPGSRERERYGDSAMGVGWSAEAGVAGELWGPVGYSVRFRYSAYADRFSGMGTLWSEGGAAEESYATLAWFATVRF